MASGRKDSWWKSYQDVVVYLSQHDDFVRVWACKAKFSTVARSIHRSLELSGAWNEALTETLHGGP